MGGIDSEMYMYFKSLLTVAFYEVRKHMDDLIAMIEIMYPHSNMPCFARGEIYKEEIRDRVSTRFNQLAGTCNEFKELVD